MKRNKIILLAVAVTIFILASGVIGYLYADSVHSEKEIAYLREAVHNEIEKEVQNDNEIKEAGNSAAANGSKLENAGEIKSVDISELQNTNPDIFAWINIPGTSVDYPVAQHPTNDSYYLKHGADGMYSQYGCPYIELSDSQTFDDFNTVIYGHNMNDGSMFASLHKFEDKSFFVEHRILYVYTSEHAFSYEIFASVMYSDAHIPYYFNDANDKDRTAFLKSLETDIVSERSIIDKDISVTGKDKIITLSTCDKKLRSNRFLVVAVLKQVDGQDV